MFQFVPTRDHSTRLRRLVKTTPQSCSTDTHAVSIPFLLNLLRTKSSARNYRHFEDTLRFLNEISRMSALRVGRESSRAFAPRRETEARCFSFDRRKAVERLNAHRLEWLVRTLSLPLLRSAFRHSGSFILFVLIPLVSRKNLLYATPVHPQLPAHGPKVNATRSTKAVFHFFTNITSQSVEQLFTQPLA